MLAVADCIFNDHDLRLVALAALICALSATAAFTLEAGRERSAPGRRWLWLLLTGLVAGGGVWAVHFVAMLAYVPDLPVKFRVGGTALSFIVAVAGLSVGFGLATLKRHWSFAILGGATVGMGVVAMHFTGISATVSAMRFEWNPAYVVASILIGAVFGAATLFAATRLSGRAKLVVPPLLLVLTIVGMHFTAMAAIEVVPDLTAEMGADLIDRHSLAIPVGIVAGLLLIAAIAATAFQAWSQKNFNQTLQVVFHSVPAGLAQFDDRDRLVVWNRPYEDLMQDFGVKPFVGMDRGVIVQAAANAGAFDQFGGLATYLDQLVAGSMIEGQLANGRRMQIQACPSGDGGTLTVITDVTDLRNAAIASEAASRAKSAFLTNMSHEIRTPLNGVLGMVQVMETDSLSEPQRDRLGTIRASGEALLAILNDVLDLSKIEAGRLELKPTEFDLNVMVRTACDTIAGVAANKGLTVACSVDPVVAGAWRGDAMRIRQILGNLLGNAVKFTETGEVRLSVVADLNGVAFEVSDTGIGIEPEKIASLFERFSQEDVTTTRRFGGTGLGLSICSELAELMSGRIWASSVKGQGSVFRVVLPLERTTRAARAPESTAPSMEMTQEEGGLVRILAAEDNLTNQTVLRSLLAPLGAELTIVGNGQLAVDAFRASDFDVVLMDIQMPVMNGVEAARAIRSLEADTGITRTPIIAVTANVMQQQLAEYLAAGMDATVPKPIELPRLYAQLDAALRGEPLAA